MPTIRFNLTKADKKSKKKDSSPFLASETEPPVVMSADVNIPAATPTHPTLYLTRSKRAKLGNQQHYNEEEALPKTSCNYHKSDTDEAAVIAEAIERANSERNNTFPRHQKPSNRLIHTSRASLQLLLGATKHSGPPKPTTTTTMKRLATPRPSIARLQSAQTLINYQPQTDLFDESDVDDDDQDDDYSVRSDDDRKIPAPTRPKSTRKRQFDDSDVPASSPDASPAKRMRFQTQKQPEIRYKTRQYVRECGSQQINFVGRSDLHTTKSKVRNSSGAPRPAKRAPTYENRSDQSGDIAAQNDPMANPISQFPTTTMIVISFSTAAATFGSPSVHIFPHNANVILRPTGFEILPTPIRPRAPPTPPSDVPSPNYQRPIRDQPNGHARVPNYNGDPVDDDEMTDASDDIPARSTTNIYRDDDMDDDDDDDSDVVNASSVFSIYCPCPKQLCLSVRDQTLPTKAQKVPADVEVEEQSNGDKKESPKQLDALPMIQNSPYSVPDSSDNDDSTDTSSFIPDSFTVKTLDSLTLMDRMTTRKATKNIKMTKNIPRPARPLPPTKSKQFATPINVANPFLCQATYQCCNPIHHFN
ncbi:hypothetical protein MHU86_24761 [Fragilaria crotonensis]|nr:hypothetical protein MHU86_24761 [Fragilaria crotonensis]